MTRQTLRERLAATGVELRYLADRVRALIETTVTSEAPAEALGAAAEAVERALAALAPHAPRGRPQRYPEPGPFTSPNDFMPFDPLIGRFSPMAPPIEMTWDDGKVLGRVTFGAAYEGPPGCVHGGVLAAAFDQVLNVANLMAGTPGPTVRLDLRYRRPTPLGAPLVFEAWAAGVRGKRIHARGRLLHGDQVTVEAEGVFIQIPVERVMKLLEPSS
jgi:acyl-coenzyme A thioesterase PaaI-like protein